MIGAIRRWLGWTAAPPTLFEARSGDAAPMAALHAASFRRGWSESEFEQLLSDRSVLAHGARPDGARTGRALQGFIMARMAAGEAEILSVAVSQGERGRGLGARLLRHHLGHLAGRGIGTVFLEVDEDNAPARRLYARAGFSEVARRPGYYAKADGSPTAALVLRRDLA